MSASRILLHLPKPIEKSLSAIDAPKRCAKDNKGKNIEDLQMSAPHPSRRTNGANHLTLLSGSLRRAPAAEDVLHRVIPFLACVLKNLVARVATQRYSNFPGFCVHVRVFNRRFVIDRIAID